MGYLPIFLDLGGRPCIVIGGGEVAEAKVRALVEAGAIVTVVSPTTSAGIKQAVDGGKVRHIARAYRCGDLQGNCLAYVVTGDAEAASHAATEARELGIPINVADNPKLSSFISPATFKRGDLQIAISTSGSSPAVARMVREQLEQRIGPEYAFVLEIMRGARHYLRRRQSDHRTRARILNSLAATLLASVETLDNAGIDAALKLHLDADMAQLGIDGLGASASQRVMSEILR